MEFVADFIRSIPSSPKGLLDFVTNLLMAHGYIVIFLGAALDNFGLPASGDVVLFAGGYFANQGQAALTLVMLCGFAGGLVSDNSVYWIGRVGGRPLISRLLKIRLLHFLVDEKSLAKVEAYFEKQGGRTVFLGRFGPGLRSMTPLFSGVSRMSYYKFFPYNLAAGVVWSITYTLIGYIFGQFWDELLAIARSVGFGFIAVVILFIALYVLRRRRKKNKKREEG
ncbi:MAG: DedA family protein [Rubrobacteraceae bacterium]|jgi:membrane protein DedA with SNARE-associated domain